ncbi:pro-FMRFamide-related neuropeptide VF isoform 2-T2 [Pelodytes ibericus]
MEIFSASKIMFCLLGLFAILFSSSVCLDETTTTDHESQEGYEDLFESREDAANQRNGNSEEHRYWGPDGLNEFSSPMLIKFSNLPIQLERDFLEERGIKPSVNLPQRFGRGSEDKVLKTVPNLPQRFGRYLPGKVSVQSSANLPQRFGRSSYGGRFVHSLASLPLRFGRSTHLKRVQYDMNPHPLEIKTTEEDNDKIQSSNYDYERKLQM